MNIIIDTISFDDYDKVLQFLLRHKIPILSQKKSRLTITAEMSPELVEQLQATTEFTEAVLIR